MKNNGKITLVINRNGMGNGPEGLQKVLIKNYMSLLVDGELEPAFLCFYGEGVKLATEGSEILGELRILEERGVRILICKTCLLYFDLLEKVKVGTVGTMLDIMGAQNNCDKVIVL